MSVGQHEELLLPFEEEEDKLPETTDPKQFLEVCPW